MWVCKGPVNLDSVTVTMTPAAIGARRDEDAVHLQPGLHAAASADSRSSSGPGDGIKAAEGVHDLTIGGGSITCLGKAPNMHQDGVQVMGGSRITFSNMTINCGRAADRLIDSNFFVKRAGQSIDAAVRRRLRPLHVRRLDGAHGEHRVVAPLGRHATRRSASGRFPKLTLTIGADAVSPVNSGNTVAAC